MEIFRKLVRVFLSAFFLNIVWENAHSYLYAHYRSGAITEIILLKAAVFDACIILLATLLFLYVPPFRGRVWLVAAALFIFAVGLEMFALSTGRWAYNDLMPIIPALGVGLTPAIQLAFAWWASARLSFLSKTW